jgi:hypothetical protein
MLPDSASLFTLCWLRKMQSGQNVVAPTFFISARNVLKQSQEMFFKRSFFKQKKREKGEGLEVE